jgi:hypothetical protein
MMLRHLGQVDPVPPPVRPINWPMILGWTAVVGMTLAVFNGTINLGGGKVRANRRRRSSRRVRRNVGTEGWYRSGGLYRQGNWAWDGSGVEARGDLLWWSSTLARFSPVADSVTLDEANDVISKSSLRTWDAPKQNRRRSSRRVRRNPRYRMWSGPMYAKQLAHAIREAGAHDVIAGTEHVIFRTDDLDALKARAGIAKPFLDFRGVKMVNANVGRRSSHARPKSPRFNELGAWEAIGAVRDARPKEHLDVLPPGVAAKFKKLPPGLYKYGYGPKKGEAIVRFKKATLKGALTSTRIGAKAVSEQHYVVDNFDPKFPVVVRGIDGDGHTNFRIEEYAQRFVRVPVYARKRASW